ncbi:hypothetical protein pb186bvf_019485 [Paramecium bursaria]
MDSYYREIIYLNFKILEIKQEKILQQFHQEEQSLKKISKKEYRVEQTHVKSINSK